jgi:hypothetical protein
MVDPIEIKLDEIETHVIKTQADVDRLMRDFSKPEKGKELLGQLPGGGGGFLDQIIKGISGKGGIMSAGMAGGMAAGGIMALVQIIGDAISNSKILMTVLGTIGKALGLLIDVILLPFLPILTTGIIWLFQGIMLFYRLWNSIWTSKIVQNLAAGITSLVTSFAKGLAGLLTLNIGFANAVASTAWTVIQWLWKLFTTNAVANLALSIALGPVGILLNWLYSIITGNQTPTMKLLISVGGAALSFLQWLWNTITSGGANLVVNITSAASSAVSSAVSGATSALSSAGDFLSSLLHFDQGGTVPGTGAQLAVVHGGETVTPKGQSGGSNTFNFYGYDDAKLKSSVENILRQQNNRYNA